MPTITFIDASGVPFTVAAESGASLMQAARDNGVPGILADCGGTCACGTCRIFLDRQWWDRLGSPSNIEEATLEAHDDAEPRRRLACQIMVTDEFDGMSVRMPVSQF